MPYLCKRYKQGIRGADGVMVYLLMTTCLAYIKSKPVFDLPPICFVYYVVSSDTTTRLHLSTQFFKATAACLTSWA